MYLGSDAIALAPFTDTISYLEDGDWVVLHRAGAQDPRRQRHSRSSAPILKSNASAFLVDKGNHRHFMAKEIHEQPEVVGHTLAHYIDMAAEQVALPGNCRSTSATLKRVSISACGTAYYAGLVGKYWFERFARLPVEIDVASEFRYREAPLDAGNLAHLRLAVGRDRRHAGDAALCQGAEAARRCRSSTCRPRPSRAKATS